MIGIFGLEMRTIKVSKKMIDFSILKRFSFLNFDNRVPRV